MLIEAFAYKRWADLRTVEAAKQLPPQARAFAQQQLNHLLRVEEMFKARLQGLPVPHDSTNTEQLPELAELEQRLAESHHWYAGHVQERCPAR